MNAEKYYTILTKIGKASIANATTVGEKVDFKYLAVGDYSNNPTEEQERLIHEVWRGTIGSITTDATNENWIILESVIPSDVGGFSIKEVGIFDESGQLLAIGKLPETYKPSIDQGSSKDLKIRIILEVSNASIVNLQIDTSVVLATKKDIETLENKVYMDMDDLTKAIDNIKSNVNDYIDTTVGDLSKNVKLVEQSSKNIRLNQITMAIEVETLKGALLTGVDSNIAIETFININDGVLSWGIYDSVNKMLVIR